MRAVVAHVARPDEIKIPDTGSLRGDTIALMKTASRATVKLVAAMTVHLGGYYQETGQAP